MNTLARAKATSFAGDMKPMAERHVSDAPSVPEPPRPSDAAFQPLEPFEPLLSPARRQLATERLIADMGMRVVAVDAPHIDAAVAEGLAQLGGALQVDRVVLWRKALDGASSEATHHWSSGADSPPAATRPLAIPSERQGHARRGRARLLLEPVRGHQPRRSRHPFARRDPIGCLRAGGTARRNDRRAAWPHGGVHDPDRRLVAGARRPAASRLADLRARAGAPGDRERAAVGARRAGADARREHRRAPRARTDRAAGPPVT